MPFCVPTNYVFLTRLLDLETCPAIRSQCTAQESNTKCDFSPLIESWVKGASWCSQASQSCPETVMNHVKRAFLTNGSTIAVLDDLLSKNELLNPFDRSLGYEFQVGIHLKHSSLDTTELMPQESADRILSSIIMQDLEGTGGKD